MSPAKPRGPRVLFQHQLKKKRKRRRMSAMQQTPLTLSNIVDWADEYHQRTGRWPTCKGGPVSTSSNETWQALDIALRQGHRGLPGGSSLTRVLAQYLGVRNSKALPDLTGEQILAWADAHFDRTGKWPRITSGPVADAPGETWAGIEIALLRGRRGLQPGYSMAQLLADHRDVYRRGTHRRGIPPDLTVEQILSWADAHHERTGSWPNTNTGPVHDVPSQTWSAIDSALTVGTRGLPGGSTLARLLEQQRGVRNIQNLPPLTVDLILTWADTYHERTGDWPTRNSGPIPELPGDTWSSINTALITGNRGLKQGDGGSLPRLLARHRDVRNHMALPPLKPIDILAWADGHFRRTGRWPIQISGPIPESPGESWAGINRALRVGRRGLPPGSSLRAFLRAHGRIARAGSAAK